ncbi:anaphase-promoting complex subunit-like protein [Dermatophagoides farinae]|uniref:Anaphase-promoting complex subunit 4 n=1 Tax=Dermatophagoides farinae TaxID=6954 RepID=A0A9D4P3G6_DERFA|nr:anaphase-promoting complex subunit 4-like [Dermatophagoides farinae]KAH7643228.1 anaphase-promoting complex subunit-like protein [Dermatophagoides farinae]
MTNFRKVGERLLPLEVSHIRINPCMDIVALALSSSDIAINRLFSWQRVWSIPKPKIHQNDNVEIIKIIDMVWSIDGKILAVAYNRPIDGENRNKNSKNIDENCTTKPEYHSSIAMYLIETNQRVCVHNLSFNITCLCWQVKSHCPDVESSTMKAINIDDLNLPLDSINIPYVDLCICDDELLNYPFNTTTQQLGKNSKLPAGDSNKNSSSKKFNSILPPLTRINRQDEFVSYDRMNLLQNKTINILTIGTEQNIILFYLFGYYQILNIDLKQFIHNDRQLRIDRIWISPDLNSIQVYFKCNNNNDKQQANSNLMLFETRLFGNLWKEIFLVNRVRLNIDIRVEFLHDTIKEISSIWSDVIVDIKSRLSGYQLIPEQTFDVSNSQQMDQNRIQLKLKDFIDMLIFGNISLNLERFLHDLNRKETSKLYHSFEHCIDDINRLIITRLLNTLTQILSYLDNLRGMILNDLLFGDLGLSIENVNQFRCEITWMMDKCNRLMTTMNDLKCKMLAVTRLIYKGIFMAHYSHDHNEHEYSKYCDDHLDIGRMTLQDFHLIMDFFNDGSFTNGFEFHRIERMLDPNSQSSSSSSSKTSVQMSKNDNDENIRNPYKTYLEERYLKNFLNILNDHKGKNFNEMSVEDLFRLFSGTFSSSNDSMMKFDNLPDKDSDETRKWFEMLMNDSNNIDSISENITSDWSLSEHHERLSRIKQRLFGDSFEHMNELQSKLIEKSVDKMTFEFHHDFDCTKELYEIEPISLDCHSVLCYHPNLNEQSTRYLYVGKFNQNHHDDNQTTMMTIFRFQQPLHNQIDLIQFNLIGNCHSSCHCVDKIGFYIEDCRFYNSEWMTLIITEYHRFNEQQQQQHHRHHQQWKTMNQIENNIYYNVDIQKCLIQ